MTQIPAGWYPDPSPPPSGFPPMQRWWDGARWTTHQAPYIVAPAGKPRPTTPDGQELAGWWIRVAAELIDSLIKLAVVLLASLPWLIPALLRLKEEWDRFLVDVENGGSGGGAFESTFLNDWWVDLAIGVAALALSLTYEAVFLHWKGATPGKLACGLRVRLRDQPGPMSWRTVWTRAFGKNLGETFGLIPVVGDAGNIYTLLDSLWPLWDDKNQAVHDKIAATNVVVHRGPAR